MLINNHLNTSFKLLLFLLAFSSINVIHFVKSAFAFEEEWSYPLVISPEGVESLQPAIAADETGQVHLVWVSKLDLSSPCSYDTIMYAVKKGDYWSEPQDILLSPNNRCVTEPAVAVDHNNGFLSVVWSDLFSTYYSFAPISEANSAHSWSEPVVIEAKNTRRPSIVIDQENRIHVAYFNASPDWVISHTYSDNFGNSWSPPTPIDKATPQHRLESVQIVADNNNLIHMVWTEELLDPDMSRGGNVYYTRSLNRGSDWELPIMIDGKDERYRADYGAGEIAIAVTTDNEIHLVWAGPPRGDRWHQWSSNGGSNWSEPQLVAPLDVFGGVGLRNFNAGLGLASDSDGRVHFISSSHHLVHLIWDGTKWSPMVSLMEFNAYWPRIAISEGNNLHVVGAYLADSSNLVPGTVPVWYMHSITDASHVENSIAHSILALPTPISTPYNQLPEDEPEPLTANSKNLLYSTEEPNLQSTTYRPIIWSSFWAISLIMIVVVVKAIKRPTIFG